LARVSNVAPPPHQVSSELLRSAPGACGHEQTGLAGSGMVGAIRPMNEHLISESQSPSKRQLLLAAACATATPTSTACSSGAGQSVARALRRPEVQTSGTATSPMHDLVRQAILAPSSHNTQCWRFRIAEKSITIAPDLTRRCPAVDPDDHHVFVSLGCATWLCFTPGSTWHSGRMLHRPSRSTPRARSSHSGASPWS